MSKVGGGKGSSLDLAIEKLFFEKQEGRLCGQHCINNALQSRLFNAVDLSTIAQALDEEERLRMAEYGTGTREYEEFINGPSANYDDTGYFSVQVLSQAFKNVNLDMVNWKSDDDRAKIVLKEPTTANLFICHMNDHWLAIRKFGGRQWINLNSVLKKPELLSDTYLSISLTTMQQEGYQIFVVFGELPESPADAAFKALKKDSEGKYIDENADPGRRLGGTEEDDEEKMLQRGIELSLAKTDAEAVRIKREQFLARFSNPASSSPPSSSGSNPSRGLENSENPTK